MVPGNSLLTEKKPSLLHISLAGGYSGVIQTGTTCLYLTAWPYSGTNTYKQKQHHQKSFTSTGHSFLSRVKTQLSHNERPLLWTSQERFHFISSDYGRSLSRGIGNSLLPPACPLLWARTGSEKLFADDSGLGHPLGNLVLAMQREGL